MFWAYSYLYWLCRFGHKSSITCLFVVNTVCSEFAPRQKRMFWEHTLKERGIVIFAWFQCFVCFERPSCFGHTHTCTGSVFGLFHKSVCFGVIGLVFAPRQKRMFWGHTLKERGIVSHICMVSWLCVRFVS